MTTTRPMSGVVERPPLDDRLQRVDYGPSFILIADAGRHVR